MSILSSILEKLGFGSANASPQPAPDTSAAPPAGGTAASTGTPAPASPEQVKAKLDELKQANPGLNPQTSIVDLLTALKLDSSSEHRKQLFDELKASGALQLDGDYKGTAEQNIKLHEAVLKKAAQ